MFIYITYRCNITRSYAVVYNWSEDLHSSAWRDSFMWMCVRLCGCVWHNSFTQVFVKWLVHMWSSTIGVLWRPALECVLWLIHVDVCDKTHFTCIWKGRIQLQHTATRCDTLQHTAKQCNTLQHTVTHCNTLQHPAAHNVAPCNTHCNTLQHTTIHCNTI